MSGNVNKNQLPAPVAQLSSTQRHLLVFALLTSDLIGTCAFIFAVVAFHGEEDDDDGRVNNKLVYLKNAINIVYLH